MLLLLLLVLWRFPRQGVEAAAAAPPCRPCDDIVATVGRVAVVKVYSGGCAATRFGLNKCSGAVTYAQAEAYCAHEGMRLCSSAELRRNFAAGSGCGYDLERTWSSSRCSSAARTPWGSYTTLPGHRDYAQLRTRRADIGRIEVECTPAHVPNAVARCCGDAVCPTPRPTASPTPHPTASPTPHPTASPSASPTFRPTARPTSSPSAAPAVAPGDYGVVPVQDDEEEGYDNEPYYSDYGSELTPGYGGAGAVVVTHGEDSDPGSFVGFDDSEKATDAPSTDAVFASDLLINPWAEEMTKDYAEEKDLGPVANWDYWSVTLILVGVVVAASCGLFFTACRAERPDRLVQHESLTLSDDVARPPTRARQTAAAADSL